MKFVVSIIVFFAMSGCANKSLKSTYVEYSEHDTSIHYYVEQLTRQLFLTSQAIKLNQSVAVGTFLPIEALGGKKAPLSNVLGQQIQESFVTLVAQAGLNVVEFKATKAIKIQKNQDVMLSRKVSELNARFKADYYLTGTYSVQRRNVVVNARLIEVATSNIVAAATDNIPMSLVWAQLNMSQSKNKMNSNSIYIGLN